MSKTASITKEQQSKDLLWSAQSTRKISLAAILNTMRILKKVNVGDAYYENYLGMISRYGEQFFDLYQLIWSIAIHRRPKRILEVGTRTGISLCQLLSAHPDVAGIETIVCVDPFDEWTSPNLVRSNLRYLNLPDQKPMILAIKSEDYFKKWIDGAPVGNTFDYILVDGDHTKSVARADLEAVVPMLEKGGVILFDDISTAPGECALVDMWEDFKSEHASEFSFAETLEGKGVGLAIKL
jgi:predicted O-methyltransferase YrrM